MVTENNVLFCWEKPPKKEKDYIAVPWPFNLMYLAAVVLTSPSKYLIL